ncbi:MAG: L,D-transpeptidase family protein [Cyclobacteriaceae bacterium]|nr:L,D-transpeptidase family protein [Cyclobacteriaceae bacterium]
MKFVKWLVLVISSFFAISLIYAIWPDQTLPNNVTADRLVVYKSARKLELWANGKRVKVYKVSLGSSPVGSKQYQGDGKTPEGLYFINDKNPQSKFHLNLGISYPDKKDLIKSKNPGGDIKIHGLQNGLGFIGKLQRFFDWTDGCIAVTNKEIEELYRAVPIGTPIQINP